MKIKGYCEDCEHRADPEEGEDGIHRCHESPPVPVVVGDVYFEFPIVEDTDYCSKWREKEE
jgi:hypothetical protein